MLGRLSGGSTPEGARAGGYLRRGKSLVQGKEDRRGVSVVPIGKSAKTGSLPMTCTSSLGGGKPTAGVW